MNSDDRVHILVVPGSLRQGSYNRALAHAIASIEREGVDFEVYDKLRTVPLYSEDIDGDASPAEVVALREAWSTPDALIFVTPEYNGSVPGVLKNAVDWASRPVGKGALRGKTSGIAGTSTGQYGALWAQQDLARIAGIAGARVVGDPVAIPKAREAFSESGELLDESAKARLSHLIDSVVADVSAGREAAATVAVSA
jgi:NAD(P)H-dependent FMN reductase